MRSLTFAALLLGALAFLSCRNNPGGGQSSEGIHYSTATLERQGGPGCDSEEGACARLEMVYPLAEGDGNPLAQRINDSIRTTLSRVLFMLDPEEDSTKNLEQLADQFVKSYTDFLAEAPDYELGWYIEVSHEVHFNSPKLTALELMVSSFTGGAHPIGFSETYNFFLPGGEPLKLDSLITDRAGFMQLLEKEFKLNRGLPETANLQEEGFFYDQAFALPGNYVFSAEGLYLIYNVYEVAPYALGPTEFLIPYDKLKELLNLDRVL